MRVAFVGVKRKYLELPEDYRMDFTHFHLELPWYFAREAGMEVTVTTVDGYTGAEVFSEQGKDVGLLAHVPESDLGKAYLHPVGMVDHPGYDVVVHWRKWFPEFYRPEAINVINCQDHSFSAEWKSDVIRAWDSDKLHGILCFPTWHKRHIQEQFRSFAFGEVPRLIDGLTLGVDTDVYHPSEKKNPKWLLWASDPGRGLEQCLRMFFELYRMDNSYCLNVCWPDYCKFVPPFNHPGITWHGNVANGPDLWDLFNRCGVLPYTSTFMEPSSRAHRQAMAAGSLVCYPPGMGSPSELLRGGVDSIVTPPHTWPQLIKDCVDSDRWYFLGQEARHYAISENWEVQAKRFRDYFEGVIGR